MAKLRPRLIGNLFREVSNIKKTTDTITKDEKVRRWLWALGGSAAVATELWENHQKAVEMEMLRALMFKRKRDEADKRKGDER